MNAPIDSGCSSLLSTFLPVDICPTPRDRQDKGDESIMINAVWPIKHSEGLALDTDKGSIKMSCITGDSICEILEDFLRHSEETNHKMCRCNVFIGGALVAVNFPVFICDEKTDMIELRFNDHTLKEWGISIKSSALRLKNLKINMFNDYYVNAFGN